MSPKIVQETCEAFRFGIEAEYLLVDSASYRPLWYQDLSFSRLNAILEGIPLDSLPPLDGLIVTRPHRRRMPYVVEGYHLADRQRRPIDLLPKGIEIRTPVCDSIEECLTSLALLHQRLQHALRNHGYRAVALSFHPVQHRFEGPQDRRSQNFWHWAMEAMLTYGPDINVSPPPKWFERMDLPLLDAKVNHYAPAMAALSVGSPLHRGGLWRTHGRIGKSVRTHFRSVVAPATEIHPEQHGRLEFKAFEMTPDLDEFHAFFLLWLEVIVDEGLGGRADREDRIYDLGAVAREGLAAPGVRDRAFELLDRGPGVLERLGFDVAPLERLRARAERGRDLADRIVEWFVDEPSIPAVLARLEQMVVPIAFRSRAESTGGKVPLH